jgi:formate C-acetyltransferase/4-hydroxyphenylacetate decarboxylase large subunit
MASSGNFKRFGGKFIIEHEDQEQLREIALYFQDRCMQSAGDSIWKIHFKEHEYIEKGWKSLLYTAPHDPNPDGRCILDFETALGKGLRQMINETKERIEKSEITTPQSAEKVFFWQACIRVLEGTINWANRYAKLAESMAAKEKNVKRKSELSKIAERLRRVPEFTPRNFAEAVQSWWILYLAGQIEGIIGKYIWCRITFGLFSREV